MPIRIREKAISNVAGGRTEEGGRSLSPRSEGRNLCVGEDAGTPCSGTCLGYTPSFSHSGIPSSNFPLTVLSLHMVCSQPLVLGISLGWISSSCRGRGCGRSCWSLLKPSRRGAWESMRGPVLCPVSEPRESEPGSPGAADVASTQDLTNRLFVSSAHHCPVLSSH